MALYGFFRANFTPKCMHNLTSMEIVLSNKTYKIRKIDLSVEVFNSVVNCKNNFKSKGFITWDRSRDLLYKLWQKSSRQ